MAQLIITERAISMLYIIFQINIVYCAVIFLKCSKYKSDRQTCDFSTTERTLSCMVDAMRYCSGEVFWPVMTITCRSWSSITTWPSNCSPLEINNYRKIENLFQFSQVMRYSENRGRINEYFASYTCMLTRALGSWPLFCLCVSSFRSWYSSLASISQCNSSARRPSNPLTLTRSSSHTCSASQSVCNTYLYRDRYRYINK